MLNTCPNSCTCFTHESPFHEFPELKNIWENTPNQITCTNHHNCPYQLEKILQESLLKDLSLAILFAISILSKINTTIKLSGVILEVALLFIISLFCYITPILKPELSILATVILYTLIITVSLYMWERNA
jgi:hypothetical protein